jgi:hypothetical protein
VLLVGQVFSQRSTHLACAEDYDFLGPGTP